MLQPRTHFEQVPLEVVRKIVDEELRREKPADLDHAGEKTTSEEKSAEAQEQSSARDLSPTTTEVREQS